MAEHPENAGLVVLPDGRSVEVALNPDGRFPLASTRKVLIVGALAESGESPDERVKRSEVERFYLPGTDGRARSDRRWADSPALGEGRTGAAGR